MVQLKSFKFIEPDSVGGGTTQATLASASTMPTNEQPKSSSSPLSLSSTPVMKGDGQHNQTNQVESSIRSSKSGSSSNGSLNATFNSGGNLTSASSQDQLTQQTSERDTLSSSEEYQLAKHDLVEEEEGSEKQQKLRQQQHQQVLYSDTSQTAIVEQSITLSDVTTAGSAPESIMRHELDRHGDDDDSATTRIDIVGTLVNGNKNYPETGLISSIQTPKTPRLKPYRAIPLAGSPALAKAPCQSPILRQGAMSPASKRLATIVAMGTNGGDNTSLYSFNQQRNPNSQFEIRWQNLRLSARRTKMPRFIADSSLYKFIYREKDLQLAKDTCYSPPIQHKIPPTISEEAELNSKSLARDQVNGTPPTPETGEQESEYRCILDNVSGSVLSGQITAILGPSGVGKTTLLNSLTGRNTLDGTGKVSLLGGASKRMSVVTVPQADVLPGRLTTYEDLIFTSRIKNPQSGFDHKRNVEKIVKHLHMDKFLNTKIDKLSGGEARRLSIGRELLNSPDIMILDEPTSGLDANTCKKIIIALRDIVEHSDYILDRPMSIIVTIHQPQQEVYNLFHRVYVMAIGGHAIYGGPPNLLLPTLLSQSSLNQVVQTDQLNENPAIVAIEVASGEYGKDIIEELAFHHENRMYEEFLGLGDDITAASPILTPQAFRNVRKNPLSASPRVDVIHRKRLDSIDSSIGRPTPLTVRRNLSANQLDRMSAVTSVSYASTYDAYLPEETSRLKVDKRLRRSVVMKGDFISHTLTLMSRCWLLTTRDWFLTGIRILGFLLVAAGTVQIFASTLDPNEHLCPQFESEVDNIPAFFHEVKARLNGLGSILTQSNSVHMFFFHFLLCITMVTSAITGLVFPLQMRMFIREYKNGWYSVASFVTSQTLAELPIDIIGPLITIVIAYPLCNQPESPYHWREIGYAIIMILTSIITKSQAQVVGAFLMDSVENSVFMSCVAVTFPALLSGIPIPIRSMSAPLRLVSYTSFLKYSFESLLSLRYGYGLCPCDPDVVDGFPIDASTSAIPTQLKSLVRGVLALNGANTTVETVTESNMLNDDLPDAQENIFLSYIRLVTGASNLFVPDMEELGDCSNYRSLYLMSMNIPNLIVTRWLVVMVAMFIISRFLIYFVVKIVIKLRK